MFNHHDLQICVLNISYRDPQLQVGENLNQIRLRALGVKVENCVYNSSFKRMKTRNKQFSKTRIMWSCISPSAYSDTGLEGQLDLDL